MAAESKIGTYTGTGAAVNVTLGFKPDHIRIVNATDGDIAWEWFSSMANASAIQSINVVDSGTSGAAGLSKITANGITPLNGSSGVPEGFTAGSALSESGKTFAYIATRNGEY